MSSSEQKTLDLSIQAYKQLLRAYPKSFRNEFGDSLVQVFGDLARRSLSAGGVLRLAVLWMRIFPDVGVSAIREHLGGAAWFVPAYFRTRWIIACALGWGLGGFLAGKLVGYGALRLLVVALVLGALQSAFALRRPLGDVLRWTIATAAGTFILATPFRILMNGFPPYRLSIVNEFLFATLSGAGVGLLQFSILPKIAHRPWRWIPINAVSGLITDLTVAVVLVGVYRFMAFPELFTDWGRWLTPVEFFIGGIFGLYTCLPLEWILGGKTESSMESAIES